MESIEHATFIYLYIYFTSLPHARCSGQPYVHAKSIVSMARFIPQLNAARANLVQLCPRDCWCSPGILIEEVSLKSQKYHLEVPALFFDCFFFLSQVSVFPIFWRPCCFSLFGHWANLYTCCKKGWFATATMCTPFGGFGFFGSAWNVSIPSLSRSWAVLFFE